MLPFIMKTFRGFSPSTKAWVVGFPTLWLSSRIFVKYQKQYDQNTLEYFRTHMENCEKFANLRCHECKICSRTYVSLTCQLIASCRLYTDSTLSQISGRRLLEGIGEERWSNAFLYMIQSRLFHSAPQAFSTPRSHFSLRRRI